MENFGFGVAFQTGPYLENILFNNKNTLIRNSYPGVYELKCSCELVCNDETKKKVISRSLEHQKERNRTHKGMSRQL